MNAVHLGIDYAHMALDQESDPDVQAYRTAVSGLKLVDVPLDEGGSTLLCDMSRGQPRPVVLGAWRKQVLYMGCHNQAGNLRKVW